MPPHPRRFWFRPEILQHDPGLAASAGALPAVPHERWAELAKRIHDTEQAGDDTTGDTH
jgi:hypothetical protein